MTSLLTSNDTLGNSLNISIQKDSIMGILNQHHRRLNSKDSETINKAINALPYSGSRFKPLKCKYHKNQAIVYVCQYENCERSFECPQCSLDDSNHLSQHKLYIQPLGDFIKDHRYCYLEVKIENEFDRIMNDFVHSINQIKLELKSVIENNHSTMAGSIPGQLIDKLRRLMCNLDDSDNLKFSNLNEYYANQDILSNDQKSGYIEKARVDNERELETKVLNFINMMKKSLDKWQRGMHDHIVILTELNVNENIVNQAGQNLTQHDSSKDSKTYMRSSKNNYSNVNQNQNLIASTFKVNSNASDNFVNNEHNLLGYNTSSNKNENEQYKELNDEPYEQSNFVKKVHELIPSTNQSQNLRQPQNQNSGYFTSSLQQGHTPSKQNISPAILPKSRVELLTAFPEITNKNILETLKKHGPFQISKHLMSSTNLTLDTNNSQGANNIKNPQPFCIKHGPIKMENEDIYEGEWFDQKRWGYGQLLSHVGFYYQGYWKNDIANGKGRMININGDMYEGEWMNGKYHGKGAFIGANGYKYIGDWSQDMQHGVGSEYWSDGSSYEGEYKWSKKHGKGVFKWINGEKYIGEFYLNSLHGNGVYEWPNGQKYTGVWKENKIFGEGKLEYSKDGRTKNHIEKKIFASPDCASFKKDNFESVNDFDTIINNEQNVSDVNDINNKECYKLNEKNSLQFKDSKDKLIMDDDMDRKS